jgi:uncharacterized protein (TIGR03435 family)
MIRAVVSFAVCVAVYGQSAAARFEVASVRPSHADPSSSSGIKTGHGRLDAKNVTLKRSIIGAYGVGPNQIFGGPDWLNVDRFEIVGVFMGMLQTLLAERFKLAIHRETRTIPALVLEVAKTGTKLEKAEGGEHTTNNSPGRIDAQHTTMDYFAGLLARQMDLPVVDHTGLEGTFNLKLT